MLEFPELTKLIYDFGTAPAKVEEGAHSAVAETMDAIVETAKDNAAVDTGELRDSIDWEEITTSSGEVSADAGPTAPHGRHVEWGTYKDPPQPFMGPATDEHEHELDERLGDVGEQALDAGL